MSEANWMKSLPEENRENLFAEMRRRGEQAEIHQQRGDQLSPRKGEVAVGGAHFDEFLKASAIWAVLRGIRNGRAPEDAGDVAKTEVRGSVINWNRQHGRDYATHRSASAESGLIDDVVRSLRRAAEGNEK